MKTTAVVYQVCLRHPGCCHPHAGGWSSSYKCHSVKKYSDAYIDLLPSKCLCSLSLKLYCNALWTRVVIFKMDFDSSRVTWTLEIPASHVKKVSWCTATKSIRRHAIFRFVVRLQWFLMIQLWNFFFSVKIFNFYFVYLYLRTSK